MGRGFGPTFGVDNNDIITGSAYTLPTQFTFSMFSFRNGGGGSDLGRLIEHGPAAKPFAVLNNTNVNYVVSIPFTTSRGQWSFPLPDLGATLGIVITFDGSSDANDPLVYYNGVSQSVTEVTTPVGTFEAPTTAPTFGNRADLLRCWDGVLSQFALWDRILTPGEVVILAKEVSIGVTPLCGSPLHHARGLVEYLPFMRDNISYKLGSPTISGTALDIQLPVLYPAARTRRTTTAAVGAFTRLVGGGVGGYRLPGPGGLAA